MPTVDVKKMAEEEMQRWSGVGGENDYLNREEGITECSEDIESN